MSMVTATLTWAASSAYDYTVIAKTGDVIGGITLNDLAWPFISDDGTVLFLGDYPMGHAVGAMFSRHVASPLGSVLVKQGDVIDGFMVDQIESEKRNGIGEIVFSNNLPPGGGIFRLKAKVAVPGDSIGGLTITFPCCFDLNDRGEIVFSAQYQAQDGTAGPGIFTPSRVIIKSGDSIAGGTATSVNNPALNRSGILAFNASYRDSANNLISGIFTQRRTVVKSGDTVSGLTLMNLGAPAISDLGLVGYEAVDPTGGRAFFIEHSLIAKTGDTIDGLTLVPPGDPLGPLDELILNAGAEALFSSNAMNSSGTTAGFFTRKHSVVAVGDTIAGISVGGLFSVASLNDAGQIAFVVDYFSPSQGEAVVVATPNGQ
jgi:hypothetical protein